MLKTDNSGAGLAVVVSHDDSLPMLVVERINASQLTTLVVSNSADALSVALRSRPKLVVIDGRGSELWRRHAVAACDTMKADSYTAIVPLLAISCADDVRNFLRVGADEVFHDGMSDEEMAARFDAAILRNERDTDVHPSTRLPGTRRIEAELDARILDNTYFAVCYVDLDHFKEFNDRYGWHNGDKVIRILARILHDVVKGLCGKDGFVGHIGGDDFICVVPLASMSRVCDEIVQVFDELIPLQYSEQDRRAGYFIGKDRRGQLHRVPLMTLSIGVASNQRRRFLVASEVSDLASEMKSYAKTLSGSVWALDRRRDDEVVSSTPSNTTTVNAATAPSLRVGNSR